MGVDVVPQIFGVKLSGQPNMGWFLWSRSAFPIYADSFLAILAAHFDFRKHFEPELRARCISLAKQKQVTKDADGWF